jgi:hypothetical protein
MSITVATIRLSLISINRYSRVIQEACDTSTTAQADFLGYLFLSARERHDMTVVEWCHTYIDYFFKNLRKVDVDGVSGIFFLLTRTKGGMLMSLYTS